MGDVEETYLEGMWDCTYCGTASKGSEMQCSGCGAVRPEDIKFYLPENARELTDANEIADAKSGPDWVCGYCSTSNKASQESCGQCGAPKEDGESRKVQEVGAEKPKAEAPPSQPAGSGGKSSGLPILIGVGVVALLCCVLAMIFGGSKTETLAVADAQWETRLIWEKASWVNEWSETRPSTFGNNEVRNIRSDTRMVDVSVTEKVPETREKKIDLGNGKFKVEKTTVMVDKTTTKKVKKSGYAYEQRKWQEQTPKTRRGPPSETPVFPDESAVRGSDVRLKRKEKAYIVIFETQDKTRIELVGIDGDTQENKKKGAPSTLDELKAFNKGDKWVVTYSGKTASKIEKPK